METQSQKVMNLDNTEVAISTQVKEYKELLIFFQLFFSFIFYQENIQNFERNQRSLFVFKILKKTT